MSSFAKFTLKPFAKSSSLSQPAAVEIWLKLQSAIGKIHAQEASQLSFEELYRFAYQLVLHKHGELLYSGVVETVRVHLAARAEVVKDASDELLLSRLRDTWDSHQREMRLVHDILMYLDSTYVAHSPRKMGIYDMGTCVLRDVVLRHPGIRSRVQRQLLAVFGNASTCAGGGGGASSASAAASGGDSVTAPDISLVRAMLSMLVDLGCGSLSVYVEDFEVSFCEQVTSRLVSEAAHYLAHNAVPEYIAFAENTMEGERARAARTVHPTTLPKLTALMERTLIAEHAVTLMEQEGSGLAVMLDRGDTAASRDQLRRLYRLLSQCKQPVSWVDTSIVAADGGMRSPRTLPPIAVMREFFKRHVLASGLAIMQQATSAAPSAAAGAGAGGGASALGDRGESGGSLLGDRGESGGASAGAGGGSGGGSGLLSPTALIERLIALRRRFAEGIVDGALSGDRDFARVLKEAFEVLLNAHGSESRVSEYLALYLDEQFRGGFKCRSETEVEDMLNQAVILFRFLQNKDEFEERYKATLQKRLLGGKVLSDDLEKLMIAKLKTECGFQFTSKLEGMFNDLRASIENMERFRKERDAAIAVGSARSAGGGSGVAAVPVAAASSVAALAAVAGGALAPSTPAAAGAATAAAGVVAPLTSAASVALANALAAAAAAATVASGGSAAHGASSGWSRITDVDVTVLTKVNWPSARFAPCVLPLDVAAAAEAFRVYYLASHSGRRLEWYTEKGTADVIYNVAPGRRHELTVSTYQMCVLALLDGPAAGPAGSLSFAAIAEATGVPASELTRHVLSIANAKFRILNKSSKGREIASDDVFTINPDFSSKLFRVKIPLISASSAGATSGGAAGGGGGSGGAGVGAGFDEDGDFASQLASQRKTTTEAAIVRIMKARKSMDHANLVAEVTRQLSARFRPSPVDIKKRIEDLIERDYLERDAVDKKLYTYCA